MRDEPKHSSVSAAAVRSDRAICVGVTTVVEEMHALAAAIRADTSWRGAMRRRPQCHIRQIAMYVCHVVLRMSLTEIGSVFGRDRTTVSHACRVIEDRRDDPAYDTFVQSVERVIEAVFRPSGFDHGR